MVRPKKHLGQHFLHDDNISRKIVGNISPETKNVLEIGPGTGMLTKYLISSSVWNYKAIEIDSEAFDYLQNLFPEHSDKFIFADFLKSDLNLIFRDEFLIIGNFPYNISSQILFKVLAYHHKVPVLIGMFQKEVADRVSSPPGNKKYGILSVLIQAYYDVEQLFTVSEKVFYPPPKVQSAVIKLKHNTIKSLGCNEELFLNLVKSAFNQRRKTLKNALHNFTFSTSERMAELLTKRAENLGVNDFVFLTRCIINDPAKNQKGLA